MTHDIEKGVLVDRLDSFAATHGHIAKVVADVIPGVPGTEYEGNHFFVNVHLNPICASQQATELLFLAADGAYELLTVIIPRISQDSLRSICLSFFLSRRETTERILRISIPTGIVPDLKSGHDLLNNSKIALTSEANDIERALQGLFA